MQTDISPDAPRRSFRPATPDRNRVAVSRRTLAASAGVGLALAAWAGTTTWYIAFRDEFAQTFLARQTEMRFGYEDRIAELTRRLEQEVTQNLAERDTTGERLRALDGRQALIEARQTWLRSVAEPASAADVTGSLGGRAAVAAPNGAAPSVAAPLPPAAPRAGSAGVGLRDGFEAEAVPPADRFGRLERRVEAASDAELRIAGRLADRARERLARLKAAMDATGLDLDRRGAETGSAAGFVAGDPPMGGPFVPLPAAWRHGAFGALATGLDTARAEAERLRAVARTLPLAPPLPGELDVTSPFGNRSDPFTRGLALHTGTDFRAETGAPVRATGAGRIVSAEWSGGYGNMVEIDHGGGLSTRYGHLSGFAASVGDTVRPGTTIGFAGSTGRSTGTHVHYETRLNGEPVNPIRFLAAGRLLEGGTP